MARDVIGAIDADIACSSWKVLASQMLVLEILREPLRSKWVQHCVVSKNQVRIDALSQGG